MVGLLFKNEVYAIIGTAMEVYNTLGPGFLETVYQEGLEIVFSKRNIPFIAQQEIPVFYGSQQMNAQFITNFLVYNKVIIEIKALDRLSTHKEAQLLNYFKTTDLNLGLVINIGSANKLEWQRRVKTKKRFAHR